ncbi:MAG: hypothetical protein H8E17_11090 [Deltaproteobacteria bacterium]|nr:hypothetical protein [Deltaproteobacteria bacterium]
MSAKLESRGKLKEGVDKRKRELDDRGKHIGKAVKDKKAIAEVSRKLKFPTKESAAEIKKALKKAAAATDQEFKKQTEDLEKKHGECRKAETDLSKRTEKAKQNALEAGRAGRKIQEVKQAKNPIAQAERASKKEAGFTNDLRNKQERDRKRSEKNRNVLRAQLMNTKLIW